MTNANVTGTAAIGESGEVKVKLANGTESSMIVDPSVPVTKITVVDKATFKPGTKVLVQGTKGADGTETATRVTLQ